MLGKWSITEQWLFQNECLFHLLCEEKRFQTPVTGPYPARLCMQAHTRESEIAREREIERDAREER